LSPILYLLISGFTCSTILGFIRSTKKSTQPISLSIPASFIAFPNIDSGFPLYPIFNILLYIYDQSLGTIVLPQSKLFILYLYPFIPDSKSLPINSDFNNFKFLNAVNIKSGFVVSNLTIDSDLNIVVFPTPSVVKYSYL